MGRRDAKTTFETIAFEFHQSVAGKTNPGQRLFILPNSDLGASSIIVVPYRQSYITDAPDQFHSILHAAYLSPTGWMDLYIPGLCLCNRRPDVK